MIRDNVFGWGSVVWLLFRHLCPDIDCGFKVFRRAILDRVKLVSDWAPIDTELLAGAKARGHRITDVAVTHLPRSSGKATGADLKVIVMAFRDLFRFKMRLSRELRQERR